MVFALAVPCGAVSMASFLPWCLGIFHFAPSSGPVTCWVNVSRQRTSPVQLIESTGRWEEPSLENKAESKRRWVSWSGHHAFGRSCCPSGWPCPRPGAALLLWLSKDVSGSLSRLGCYWAHIPGNRVYLARVRCWISLAFMVGRIGREIKNKQDRYSRD